MTMKLDSAGLHAALTNPLSSLRSLTATDAEAQQNLQSDLAATVKADDHVSIANTLRFDGNVDAGYRQQATFQGKQHTLVVPDSRQAEQIGAVLKRVPPHRQDMLIDSRLLTDERFLALADSLDDRQLGQLTNTLEGLQTTPQLYASSSAGHGQINSHLLLESLTDMDATTRDRVLEVADKHAAKIPVNVMADTYAADGTHTASLPSLAARDLHNFVASVATAPDAGSLMDGLEQFSDAQQSDLLQVMGMEQELGQRLMNEMTDRDTDSRDKTLRFLSELSASADSHVKVAQPSFMTPDVAALATHDNHAFSVVTGMISETLSLLENYEFSNQQLTQMSGQLQSLSHSDQRAYLNITSAGLDQLVGADSNQPADMEENSASLEVVDALRSDAGVRESVYMARMGDEVPSLEGGKHYQLKYTATGERDQNTLVEVLATDAWLNRNNDEVDLSARASHLAENLTALGGEARDRRVHALDRLAQQQVPLSELSDDYLQQDYHDFQNRTDALANTSDAAALTEMEYQTEPALRDGYWQAAGLAGEEVDQLIGILQKNDPDMGRQIVEHLSGVATEVFDGETSVDEGRERVHELINFFEANLEQDDRQRYLDAL